MTDPCRKAFEKWWAKEIPGKVSYQEFWDVWQAAYTASRWIPVSERPENGMYVNVTNGNVAFGSIYYEKEFHSWTADGLVTLNNITHWQPLPEAPNE